MSEKWIRDLRSIFCYISPHEISDHIWGKYHGRIARLLRMGKRKEAEELREEAKREVNEFLKFYDRLCGLELFEEKPVKIEIPRSVIAREFRTGRKMRRLLKQAPRLAERLEKAEGEVEHLKREIRSLEWKLEFAKTEPEKKRIRGDLLNIRNKLLLAEDELERAKDRMYEWKRDVDELMERGVKFTYDPVEGVILGEFEGRVIKYRLIEHLPDVVKWIPKKIYGGVKL